MTTDIGRQVLAWKADRLAQAAELAKVRLTATSARDATSDLIISSYQ